MAGDILRRLVARTVAREIRQKVERATAPLCECIADTISRNAMLRGLRHMEGREAILPFVLQFYDAPSNYLWEDSDGVVHEILQGEGGEQGDALMPAFFQSRLD